MIKLESTLPMFNLLHFNTVYVVKQTLIFSPAFVIIFLYYKALCFRVQPPFCFFLDEISKKKLLTILKKASF